MKWNNLHLFQKHANRTHVSSFCPKNGINTWYVCKSIPIIKDYLGKLKLKLVANSLIEK